MALQVILRGAMFSEQVARCFGRELLNDDIFGRHDRG